MVGGVPPASTFEMFSKGRASVMKQMYIVQECFRPRIPAALFLGLPGSIFSLHIFESGMMKQQICCFEFGER